jgi:regulator of chromosome condensation
LPETEENKAEESKKGKRSTRPKTEKEVDLSGIYYFRRPHLVDTLPEAKYTKVFAGSNYCYALDEEANKLYSWGMGDNYVLGTREEENCYEPQLVHPKMFFECKIRTVGAGSQHIVVLTSATAESDQEPKFDFSLPLPVVEPESEAESSQAEAEAVE